MYAPRLLVVASALALAGCAFFAALSGQPSAEQQAQADAEMQRQAEQVIEQQQQADQQQAAELDALRTAAQASDADLPAALAYVEQCLAAMRAGAFQRGIVPDSHADDAWAVLDAQWVRLGEDSGPEAQRDRVTIHLARAAMRHQQGHTDEAASHYLAAIELEPSYDIFSLLVGVPKTPVSDAALLQACPKVRPNITTEQIPDFIAMCLDAASSDRKRLTWKTAKADLKAHDIEMQRRAEQERLRLEAEAQLAAQVQQWASAAVFAAGRCRFSNCSTDGWEASTDQGTVTTTCRFSNCLSDGWETRFPDGSYATTTCRFSDCMEDGWETRFPDGSYATTTCRFSKCAVDGWETRMPDGSTVTSTCRFQNCFEDGWETRLPDSTITCSCRFQNCLTDGTDCS